VSLRTPAFREKYDNERLSPAFGSFFRTTVSAKVEQRNFDGNVLMQDLTPRLQDLTPRLHSANIGEALWREKEKLALAWLEETLPTLKRPLTSDAWLGVGVK
jgi:hypothetical protein